MPGYISDVDYDGGSGLNFIEVVVPVGIDVSAYTLVIYDKDGTVIETYNFDIPPVQTIVGQSVYLFGDPKSGCVDLRKNAAVALVDDVDTVVQFSSFKNAVDAVEGPANGMTSTRIGELFGSEETLTTFDHCTTNNPTTSSTPGTVSGFAPGTLIDTPDGPRMAESLRVGDLVNTIDKGPRRIRWTSISTHELESGGQGSGMPVLIPANSVASDLPVNDLILSSDHRVVLGCEHQFRGLLAGESLAPAKALTDLPGVRLMRERKQMTWHHFAFDRHAVVRAEGLQVESLLIGPEVVKSLPDDTHAKLQKMFPGRPNGAPLNGPAARPMLSANQARQLLVLREIGALFGHTPQLQDTLTVNRHKRRVRTIERMYPRLLTGH